MHVEAHDIKVAKIADTSQVDAKMLKRITEISTDDAYELLAEALAPEIYGHDDIKKALMLLLVGGVHKVKEDGMKLRGDIHMLLMGDPGVAKSQLLKHVCRVAPRAVYTSGKGSSSVGLTAAVVKDPTTNEVTLEGGALVLADKGVCAIDEFDKMDEGDRAAIHEVMEQQTVSIAKGGITTSLNARACVVAAANPVYGRWNLNKSPVENINLPDSLLSRFDLQFVLIDSHEAEVDLNLAKHVLFVHKMLRPPKREDVDKFPDAKTIRAYVARAQKYNPEIPNHLVPSIVNMYAEMRAEERMQTESDRQTYTSPRTLIAMLRISQARARLRWSHSVELSDFEEAIRLMKASKETCAPRNTNESRKTADVMTQVYGLVCSALDRAKTDADAEQWVSMVDVERAVLARGFTHDQLEQCITYYASLDVFEWSHNRLKLRFSPSLESTL
jgi:DNA replication licensing factor MCM7